MAIRRHTSRSTVSINNRVNSANLSIILSRLPFILEYLVVAGGGGAGGLGGGGAGGYRTANYAIPPELLYTPITVTVGGGGAGGSFPIRGTNGTDSNIFNPGLSITSSGGGGGGAYDGSLLGASGKPGGSGGGGGSYVPGPSVLGTYGEGNMPSTSPSQGNNGGLPISNFVSYTNGGGGGGAGAVGANGTSVAGGAGGAGLNWNSLGTYYAAGGGGTGESGSGVGGIGGGGNGGGANPGTIYTGSGGGAGRFPAGAGAGGSGVVILRWPTSLSSATANTGSNVSYTGTGGYHTYKFYSSGTITLQ
jgi:hypothetical protein